MLILVARAAPFLFFLLAIAQPPSPACRCLMASQRSEGPKQDAAPARRPTGKNPDAPPGSQWTTPVEAAAALPIPSADLLAIQARIVAQGAIKLYVKHEGWYRVTGRELLAAGLDPGTDPRKLQLFADAKSQPLLVAGENDGRIDPTDSVEFYGIGVDSPVADTRVYWLVSGAESGARVLRARGTGDATAGSGFLSTVERKDRSLYFSALRNGEAENFFGPTIARAPLDVALFLAHVNFQEPAEPPYLEVSLQGAGSAAHRVRVAFNGHPVGEVTFDGQTAKSLHAPLDATVLKEGENHISLTPLGGDADVSLLEAARVGYGRTYTAVGNRLRFTAPAGKRVRVTGFTRPNIRVFDVTSPDTPVELEGDVDPGDGNYSMTVAAPGNGVHVLLALSGEAFSKPVEIRQKQPSELLRKAPPADLWILTRRPFFPLLEPLRALRQKQGVSAKLVDVEEVFDEFAFGLSTAAALKDFLQFTHSQQERKPRFVLLAGDATFDPKNHLGHNGRANLVPARLVDTYVMETVSDDWLTDFDDDGQAEIPVGRLPFDDAAEASRMVDRIIRYGAPGPDRGVLLVSDDSFSGYDFTAAVERLRPLLPPSIEVQQIERGKAGAQPPRQQLSEALMRGQRMVNYMGHGSVDIWRGDLMTAHDARRGGSPDQAPLYVIMTCLNGYFVDPALESIAEGLMKAEQGGAVAVWASSGQTDPSGQSALNQEFFKLAFQSAAEAKQPITLGEAALQAKAAVDDVDIRRTWILFGDPSMPLF